MTLIPFPDLPCDISWTPPATKAQEVRSQWTNRSKVMRLNGSGLWRATIAFEPIYTEADERKLRAFIYAMDGITNSTYVPRGCQQYSGGAVQIGASPGNGNTAPLTGFPPSQTVLEAGQHLTIQLPTDHRRLVGLTAPLVSNASGQAMATFVPQLSMIPFFASFVEIAEPYCQMRLANPDVEMPHAGGETRLSIEMVEAL